MSGDRPWMKFYPRDWRGDQALRAVSIAARGLWLECLCIMHEARPYDEAHDIAEAARDYHEAAAAERAWSERKDALRGPLLAALGERKRVRAGDLTVEVQGGKTPRLVVRPAREEIA